MDPITIALAVSTGISFLGSVQQSRQLRRAARADKRRRQIQAMQQRIQANEKAALILSEKRALQAARGIAMNQGSSLLESTEVTKNLNDTLYWIEKGLILDNADLDFRLAGALTKEAYNRGINLVSGIANTYYIGKQRARIPRDVGTAGAATAIGGSKIEGLGRTDLPSGQGTLLG
tara:strand:+ start:2083 stop:2610 length:528 start_codon:yes stop_codon:yes gene_type:complete